MSGRNESFNEVIAVDSDDEKDAKIAARTAVSSTAESNDNIRKSNEAACPSAFRLPDGRMMDSKNTLQSFDDIAAVQSSRQRATATMKPNIMAYMPSNVNHDVVPPQPASNYYPFQTGNDQMIIRARGEAVPVQSVLVAEGELVQTLSELQPEPMALKEDSLTPAAVTTLAAMKRSKYFWISILLIIILVGIIAGIGGYCGSGKCGGDTSFVPGTPSTSIPMSSPPRRSAVTPSQIGTANPATAATTASDQELNIACTFLNFDNITACQGMTSFAGGSLGTTIPTEIGSMTQLALLSLDNNQFVGTVPTEIGLLTQLRFLSLFLNHLTGTLPTELGRLTQLTLLSLNDNLFTGTIPTALGSLMELNKLHLHGNPQLVGTVPASICSVPNVFIYIECDNEDVVCTCCRDGTALTSCTTSSLQPSIEPSQPPITSSPMTSSPVTSPPVIQSAPVSSSPVAPRSTPQRLVDLGTGFMYRSGERVDIGKIHCFFAALKTHLTPGKKTGRSIKPVYL